MIAFQSLSVRLDQELCLCYFEVLLWTNEVMMKEKWVKSRTFWTPIWWGM